jgi:enoyl-CoA hydratase
MTDTLTYETLLVERQDAIVLVTLNRPKALNALNALMVQELADCFRELDADNTVHAIVLTGSGEKAFAAGADIGELHALNTALAGVALSHTGHALTQAMERMRTPIIAAVNGFALGGGCELALACDIRIAGENARFGQPEVNLGLIPGFGGTQRTAHLLGRGMAMYLCLTGEMLNAEQAQHAGLCEKVVPTPELLNEAKRIANLIAAKAPLAVAAVKHAIDEGSGMALTEGLALEALHFGSLVDTKDFGEGTKAFLEKRSPRFTGT